MLGTLRVLLALILSVSALGSLGGCSHAKVDENDPVSLMEDAERDIQATRWQIAIDKLRVVRNKFPYSPKAVEAHLRIGDVFYLQESFLEAALQYESFVDLYPKHAKVPYALFRVAESNARDAPDVIARDQGSAQKAVDGYEEFLRRFPAAPEAEAARKGRREMLDHLAAKELYIATFYLKWKEPLSARGRLQKLLDRYPDSSSADEAKRLLLVAEQRIAQGVKSDD